MIFFKFHFHSLILFSLNWNFTQCMSTNWYWLFWAKSHNLKQNFIAFQYHLKYCFQYYFSFSLTRHLTHSAHRAHLCSMIITPTLLFLILLTPSTSRHPFFQTHCPSRFPSQTIYSPFFVKLWSVNRINVKFHKILNKISQSWMKLF